MSTKAASWPIERKLDQRDNESRGRGHRQKAHRRFWPVLLQAFLLPTIAGAQSVTATGPDGGTRLEDRIEIMWSPASPLNQNESFAIRRDGDLIAYAAAAESVYEDAAAEPDVTYNYCVYVRDAADVESVIACDTGGRAINRPTGFDASDGFFADMVLLEWSDRSQIEAGYNIYRDAGNALDLDGSDDYVAIPGVAALPASFTVEFWTSRASNGTEDFVVNLESVPEGNPTNVDLEIGFNSLNQFTAAFGGNVLATADAYTDPDWHHWAVTYDAASRRRTVYRDGVEVATDVYTQNFTPSGNLELGRREDGGNVNNRGHYHGLVDELRLWNTVLGQAQIESLIGGLLVGSPPGLVNHWPMDVTAGVAVPDIVGTLDGTIIDPGPGPSWSPTGIPGYHIQIGADLTAYADRATVPNFQSYAYEIAAFEDIDDDGVYMPGVDFESAIAPETMDMGWRAGLAPPGDVSATDGQFDDRVRVIWTDRSDGETNFIVHRDGGMIAVLPANTEQYDDFGAVGTHTYCVESSNGVPSIQTCDVGRVGGLAPPDEVMATNGTFDDRVQITWSDTSDTEDGFEILRNGGPVGTTSANAEEFNDLTALQEEAYTYCVRAFSNADPANPTTSAQTCAPGPGLRAAVLAPDDVVATDNDFEDRVEISWSNPSTTAMLFRVYRDGALIDVLDFATTMATDMGILSDTEYEYCVAAETVVPDNAAALKDRVARLLERIRYEDAVRLETGGVKTAPEAVLASIHESIGIGVLGKTGEAADGVESAMVCDDGSRLLNAPTEVDATDDEFENHVQISWMDNSSVETGYTIFRAGAPIATLSPNRTTYGDYSGPPGVGITYEVQAFDDFDTSELDGDPGRRTLTPPTGLDASDGTSETIVEIEWTDNSGAEKGYRVYRREAGSVAAPGSIGETGTNEPAFRDTLDQTGGMLGEVYEYFVAAFDDHGESARDTDEGHTFLEVPANVNASDLYFNDIVVIWVDRSEVEDEYRLTRRPVGAPSGAFDLDLSLPAGTTMYTDNAAVEEVEYEYCVLSVLTSSGVASEAVCDVGIQLDPDDAGPEVGPMAFKIYSSAANFFSAPERFGISVAMDDENALIGASEADPLFGFTEAGIVNRYSPLQTLEETWSGEAFQPDNDFGHAVDIDGNYAVIGAPFLDETTSGSFAVWRRAGVVPTWIQTFTTSEFDAGGDNTGISVAVKDSFIVVGANLRDLPGVEGQGGAIVCNVEAALDLLEECSLGQTVVQLEEVLAVSQWHIDAELGYDVDITRVEDTLFVIAGAPGVDLAYIFECDVNTGCDDNADWSVPIELESRFSPNRRFGAAVAIDSGLAVVGAPDAEAIVIFERIDGEWVEGPFVSPSSPGDFNGFGSALAIRGTTIVVGAPNEEIADLEDAGAIYVYEYDPTSGDLSDPVRYDTRVAGNLPVANRIFENSQFGASVALDTSYYLVGAPNDRGQFSNGEGAAYAIPIGLDPPDEAVVPPGVTLTTPGNIRASDGSPSDRIQVQWDDVSTSEDGHVVFRSNESSGFDQIAEVPANVEFYDDIEAAPGEAYTYCVAAYFEESTSDLRCDIGWLPPNGTIAGQLRGEQGGGTEDALVCLEPSPNKGLLFDGFGGYVGAPVGEEYDISDEYTIEAWIRPHDVTGTRYIVSKDSAYALALHEGVLRLVVFGDPSDDVVDATHAPLSDQAWHHVAVSVNGDVTFWVDGMRAGKSASPPLARIIGDSLMIGQSGTRSGFYKGEIDEVRVWNTELDSASIVDSRVAPLEGDEENLLGYWPLDDGLRRIAPDVTELANHGILNDGVYLADEGAPLEICALSTSEGNYSITGIRYGESTEFDLVPMHPRRRFSPSFKKITLTTESPVQNEVVFIDVTSFAVAGNVQYVHVVDGDSLVCPVPDVRIHVDKSNAVIDDNVLTSTGEDGTYVVGVDPSEDARDTWFIIPEFVHPEDNQLVHSFEPEFRELAVQGDSSDINFVDETSHMLTVQFSGGDPENCNEDIGIAEVRLYTQDGCYDRTFFIDSSADTAFAEDLPPLEYLMEVVEVTNAPSAREEDIQDFFNRLGSVEVDLTRGDAERNLVYRAPLVLTIGNFPVGQCTGGIDQLDEDGNLARTLPDVGVVPEFGLVPLTIQVQEDYGGGLCPVEEGELTIFDGISDREDTDSTMAIQDGQVLYTAIGASPNIISGARVQGIDRSFQKPFTVVARVEGRDPLLETRWALVEGFRERASTFVSATTSEFPLLVLHDPPGGESFASIEKGTSFCSSVESVRMVSGGAGPDIDVAVGFKLRGGFSGFGSHFTSEFGAGVLLATRTIIGGGSGDMWDENEDGIANDNFEICMTTSENLATSTDPGWAGEDIHMGVALNLIFAIADVLDFNSCQIELSETLATDLDMTKPFETTYVYGESHISSSLIPELENLIELAGGDATLEGELNGQEVVIRLEEALQNWEDQLETDATIVAEALKNPAVNRSFSGGTEFSYSESADTAEVVRLETRSLFIDTDNAVGVVITAGAYDQKLAVAFEIHAEWEHEESDTEGRSKTVGYVLHEEDAGDYFSVDVAKDPRFGTFVFGTRSGRSSGFCEENTQCRDNPLILSVDPPVLFNVDPAEGGNFEVSLANASESNERRQYILAAPATTNPKNLSISAGGGVLGEKKYLLEPGTAVTVNVGVRPGPSAWAYENVALTFFSEADRVVWEGDTRLDFEAADSAFFSVFFDSTGGNAMATPMAEGWTWFSVNREGGNVNQVLSTVPAHHGDLLRSQTAEARFDSTGGWTGDLRTLVPGAGYRIRLQQPTVFRITGEAVDDAGPIRLEPGWNWIGYVPAKRLSVDDALESLSDRVQEGDLVVGQRSFAQYVSGKGWIGTLDAMAPGESYTISLARGGELRYPTDLEDVVRPMVTVTEQTINGPAWVIRPEQFDGAMTMVAEVQHKGTPLDRTTTRVAVFAGDSLRGVGDVQYVESLGRYMTFVMIYGGHDLEEEPLMVHVYDGAADELYEQVGQLTYAPQTVLGEPAVPVVLELAAAGQAPELLDVPEAFALHQNYPNPFNPTTTIAYDLPESATVRIRVFDVLGRLVATLIDEEKRAGRHKVVFDAEQLASGFYVYRIKAGNYNAVQKMIVIK